MLRVGVLASGEGTNFQALHDACDSGYVPAEIAVVLTNRRDAGVLRRAAAAGVDAIFVDPAESPSRDDYDHVLLAHLDKYGVELVCHAGYMRIAGSSYCEALSGRALNIHPSLLPAFPGLHGVRQAFEHGVKVTGATVHLVTEGVDEGPIVCQRAVEVLPGETLESLEERVHLAEYAIYPKAVRMYAETGGFRVDGRRVIVDHDIEDPPWAGALPPGLLRGGSAR